MIRLLECLPEELLNLPAEQLHTRIEDHTLIHLSGKIQRPLFISILQHGDEHTGWDALRDYLKNHLRHGLPRSLFVLFGNVRAAALNLRKLPDQPDFNRRWPGRRIPDDPVARIQREITDYIRNTKPFASVDIHNNSGRNPHYSGINKLSTSFLNLASLFSSRMIYFTSPDGIQSSAFSAFCPAITVESGQSGTADGREQTHTFLELLTTQSTLEHVPGVLEHLEIYRVFASVKVKPGHALRIDSQPPEENDQHTVVIKRDLDFLNFQHAPAGTVFGWHRGAQPMLVEDQEGRNITAHWFGFNGPAIVLRQPTVPAMITQKIQAIRDDSLCYLMHPLDAESINLSTT